MWPVAKFIYTTMDPVGGGQAMFTVILLLSILVFKLGFSKKLPPLKAALIYFFLFLGCSFLTFFAIFLPIAEGLVIAALILIIYKIRLNRHKKMEQST
ncbi:YlaH-like family protein [Metabacillus sp. FJAT-52054]|uniref:YlaH-like family protein n=1 Tax=Metabacillus sediminis TaxID=3117746 RepID=A0ABZ2NME2_9BACI